jgi:polysaccharide biosynthesis/export protein
MQKIIYMDDIGEEFFAMICNYFIISIILLGILSSCSSNGPLKQSNTKYAEVPALKTDASSIPTSYYVLGEGDQLNINVWRHDSMKRALYVDTSGNVSLPLVGQIRVAGLTVQQANEEITLRLSKYFINPQVDIQVTEIRSQKIYLLGEVTNPGSFPLDHKTSVWEIIAKGAFSKDANMEKVLLISNNIPNGENQRGARISVLNLNPAKIEADSVPVVAGYLQNGDIIYVPPLKIANVSRFMTHLAAIISPILGAETSVLLIPQVIDVMTGKYITTGGGVIVGQ